MTLHGGLLDFGPTARRSRRIGTPKPFRYEHAIEWLIAADATRETSASDPPRT
jgi:hypothetical protein